MFSKEFRPLKRPKLGIPDYYPQDDKQKEDELTFQTLNCGFRLSPLVDSQDEIGSALKEFSQQLLNTKEYTARVTHVVEAKKRNAWVQDSQKRKVQVTKDNFFPVPLGRNRKEIASSWFQDLAGSKPLVQLAKKVPVFNKKEEIFDNLCEKDVPISRAAWYIKMTAAYTSTMTDSKLNKKKQSTDPSFDWTASLTKYMQECVWRICNESVFSRHESHSTSRTPSIGNVPQTPTEESLAEVNRWQYMVHLSSWLYEESLLDCHEFLRWMVERVEHIKANDTKALQLYLPLVLRHLLDIGSCVSLARPLVNYCCQRLAILFDLDQKLKKFQIPQTLGTAVKPTDSSIPETMETCEEDDKDSVFNHPVKLEKEEASIKQEKMDAKSPCSSQSPGSTNKKPREHKQASESVSASREKKQSTSIVPGDGEDPSISESKVDVMHMPAHFGWCAHHSGVMLQLSCIIQTAAIKCPTAFVHTRVAVRGMSSRDGSKGNSPLDLLPVGLPDLPMVPNLRQDLQRKLLNVLVSAEQEIHQRSRASECGWSSMTVADLQTTSEGSNIQKILKILDVLDNHAFYSCRTHNPLTTLYCRLAALQKTAEVPLGDDMLVMLLCQWAVTPHRAGEHRPLMAARLLLQRQTEILKGEGWRDDYNLDAVDDSWEEASSMPNSSYVPDFPFQSMLFKFLDTRAPLPDDLATPLKGTDAFFRLVILFSELIRLNVFSYTNYLSTLIARGEIKSPIIPLLPFARDAQLTVGPVHKPLSLTISYPALKKPRLDNGSSLGGSQSTLGGTSSPPSPGSLSGFGFGGQQDTFSSALNFISGSDSGSTLQLYQPEQTDVDENTALQLERKHKLESLLASDSHESSQLMVSPLSFNSPPHDADAASSPLAQSKSDPFNFSLSFPPTNSLFMEEDHSIDVTINKRASRHLLYATYFPISDSHLTKQELNERAVVLSGVGKTRNRVERIVKKITVDIEHYFRLLSGISTAFLPDSKLQDIMQQFRALPSFEQRIIATACEKILRSSLKRRSGGSSAGIHYPACTQLVFVCELLEVSGGIQQILELLVDIIACDHPSEQGDEKETFEAHRPLPPLPADLCLPVVSLLQKYFSCLILSQQDTAVVFEGLCRVLEYVHRPTEVNASQKAVFVFLHKLYTNCSYLQKTYRTLFGPYCLKMGQIPGMLKESFPPTKTDSSWHRTMLLVNLTKPSTCSIPQMCAYIQNNSYLPYPKTIFIFVTDVFSSACQKNINCPTLCDLARVCAEVCCACGPLVNSELMGAFRALCLPTTMKSCHTGFTHLTCKTNILMDPGIHSNLVTFVALLVANGCFLLSDIISYIIKPIIRIQLMHPQGTSQHSSLSLEFVSLLVLHLLVDDYIDGHHTSEFEHPISLPPFVRHYLHAKCRELDFTFIISLLKDLLSISQHSTSRGTTIGSVKSGMQILVQSIPSGSESNESVLNEVRKALEMLASQDWVREKCIRTSSKSMLLDTETLGGTSLTPTQARYLLNLLSPYTANASLMDAQDSVPLHSMDSGSAIEHILKNLDQWTLRNALLHINVHISQASPLQVRFSLLDHLASQVICVFEDSCGDEWLGQTIECCVESGDGAYSPSVWLVTPLISRLQQTVLGRVLKSAGNVLGQGQWWNPEKSQEKRRATRATSGVAAPKTGLQWQQPFLELVLACMHAQSTTHEELLGPLKTQISTFLAAFEKEGMPSDEQGKTMLYAALKLRLSLVGSMLGSICVSEAATLEWVPLLMQLICSGAVDRQTDSSELFTNCLDMLCSLLHSLHTDFHICLATGGEEGKKTYTSCIKKLKSELSTAKSACLSEIQQLFPLTQKSYSVITVKQPAFTQKGHSGGERIKGLRVQDTREISPWDILEGVKYGGPLMLSWFGAVRMKRKPLKYEEQKKLVSFHSHQNRFKDMMYKPYYVSLPDPTPQDNPFVEPSRPPTSDPQTPAKVEGPTTETTKPVAVGIAGQMTPGPATAIGSTQSVPMRPPISGNQMQPPGGMTSVYAVHQTHPPMQQPVAGPRQFVQPPPHGMLPQPTAIAVQPQPYQTLSDPMRKRYEKIQTLKRIEMAQRGYVPPTATQPPPMYPGHTGGQTTRAPAYAVPRAMSFQEQFARLSPQSKAVYIQRQRMRQQQQQQQQQRMAMAVAVRGQPGPMMGQFNPQFQQVQPMRPMQATPAMPMQQVMQQASYPAPQQQHVMMRVPTQPNMQFAQPRVMNPMHRQPPLY